MDRGFTDIHTHIVPGIDDGAEDMDESICMIKKAYDDGVRNIIATPHAGMRNMGFDAGEFRTRLDELSKWILEDGGFPGLRLFSGNEVYYSRGAIHGVRNGAALTLAGSEFVLCEFPFETSFDEIYGGVCEFLDAGYYPVIAHAERYSRYIKKIDNLAVLVREGAFVQLNGSTVVDALSCGGLKRKLGKDEASWAYRALSEGLVHFISSDCHDSEYRVPELSDAAEALRELVGERAAERILYDNPEWIIGESVEESLE